MARHNRVPGWIKPLVRNKVRASAAFVKRRYHNRMAFRAIAGHLANLEDVEHFVSDKFIPLTAPLVLISQAQRSGGTLLSQLFDGHPAIAAYPHELKFGVETTDTWPVLDPTHDARETFLQMMDANFPRLVRRGFAKGDQNPERYRFALITRIQYAIFKRICERTNATSQRDFFDAFFTAFFNGWLDYQGRLEDKRCITAFAPRLANEDPTMERFAKVYPDGFLIQIIREPKGWFGSTSNHAKTKVSGAERILAKWIKSAEGMLRNRSRFGERQLILRFEDLVARPEATMKAVVQALGIEYDIALLQPTFNGHVMRANSSFDVAEAGLVQGPLEREKALSEADRSLIDAQTKPLYERVLAQARTV